MYVDTPVHILVYESSMCIETHSKKIQAFEAMRPVLVAQVAEKVSYHV